MTVEDPTVDLVVKDISLGDKAKAMGNLRAAKVHYLNAAEKLIEWAECSPPLLRKLRYDKAKEYYNIARAMEKEVLAVRENVSRHLVGEERNITLKTIPRFKFEDIVGLDDVIEDLKMAIVYPEERPDLFQRFKVTPGTKMLFVGPPGCGKTMLAEACASSLNIPLYSAKCDVLFSKWVGDTEKNIAELFSQIRQEKKALLLLDEIDSLVARRSHVEGSTVARRAVTEFLIHLSQPLENAIVIGTTNCIIDLDSALLRPGRFSPPPILIPPPTEVSRRLLFKKALTGVPVAEDVMPKNCNGNCAECCEAKENCGIIRLAEKTRGFSAADINEKGGVVHKATLIALKDELKGVEGRKITMSDFESVLEKPEIQPSILSWILDVKRSLKKPGMMKLYPQLAKLVQEYEVYLRAAS